MATPYTPEFKQQAVRLVKESGLSIRKAAEDLGVATESVRNWVRRARVDAGEADG
jgi:transposase